MIYRKSRKMPWYPCFSTRFERQFITLLTYPSQFLHMPSFLHPNNLDLQPPYHYIILYIYTVNPIKSLKLIFLYRLRSPWTISSQQRCGPSARGNIFAPPCGAARGSCVRRWRRRALHCVSHRSSWVKFGSHRGTLLCLGFLFVFPGFTVTNEGLVRLRCPFKM